MIWLLTVWHSTSKCSSRVTLSELDIKYGERLAIEQCTFVFCFLWNKATPLAHTVHRQSKNVSASTACSHSQLQTNWSSGFAKWGLSFPRMKVKKMDSLCFWCLFIWQKFRNKSYYWFILKKPSCLWAQDVCVKAKDTLKSKECLNTCIHAKPVWGCVALLLTKGFSDKTVHVRSPTCCGDLRVIHTETSAWNCSLSVDEISVLIKWCVLIQSWLFIFMAPQFHKCSTSTKHYFHA